MECGSNPQFQNVVNPNGNLTARIEGGMDDSCRYLLYGYPALTGEDDHLRVVAISAPQGKFCSGAVGEDLEFHVTSEAAATRIRTGEYPTELTFFGYLKRKFSVEASVDLRPIGQSLHILGRNSV